MQLPILVRLFASAVAVALLVLEVGSAAYGADPTYPTGSFSVDRTSAYFLTIDGDPDRGSGSFWITPSSIHDDETATTDLEMQVDPGDGRGSFAFPGSCLTQRCGLSYDRPGAFLPQVSLTDQDGHTTTIPLPKLTVLRDDVPPVTHLTKPRPRLRHRIAGWRVLRGTAIDRGVGLMGVLLFIEQKRHRFWYFYDGTTRTWRKGLRTEAGTMGEHASRSDLNVTPAKGSVWHSPRIRGLTRGPLVVRIRAIDLNFYETDRPRILLWTRLNRR